MLVKVQDIKKPNREPFETSEAGLLDLQRISPGRYKSLDKVIVTAEKIEVTPLKPKSAKEVITPAKVKRG